MTPAVELRISLTRQQLTLTRAGAAALDFAVSTSRYGPGERAGSLGTPRGRHVVRARIGAGLPVAAVLSGRRPTGEICTPERYTAEPGRDWILTRILWLSGTEPGRNRGGQVDTMRRYIYIHGAPDEAPMGVPFSHGCVRMRNEDLLTVFGLTPVGTPVLIHD